MVDLNLERAAALATDVGAMQAGVAVATKGRLYQSAPVDRSAGTPVPHAATLAAVLDFVDAVYIGTTPTSHKALVEEALAAGKHVLLEKPIAASAADADAIVAAAEAAETSVVVNIGMRYNDALKGLRTALHTKQIGTITGGELRLHFKQWPRAWQTQPWCANRLEGGPLREVGTHFFFGLFELFGSQSVRRVKADVVWPDGEAGCLAESEVKGLIEIVPSSTSGGGVVAVESQPILLSLSVLTNGAKIHEDGTDLYELELENAKNPELGSYLLHGWTSLRGNDGTEMVENATYGRKDCVHSLREAAGYAAINSDNVVPGITAREARAAQLLVDGLLTSNGEWLQIDYN